jgi:methyltransferase-like protein
MHTNVRDETFISASPRRAKCWVFFLNYMYYFKYLSYAGTTKTKVRENKQEVVDAVQRTRNRNRKVIMRAFSRQETKDGVFSLVLECMIPKKLKKRKPKWEDEGYQVVKPYLGPYVTLSNQTFRVRFEIYIKMLLIKVRVYGKQRVLLS